MTDPTAEAQLVAVNELLKKRIRRMERAQVSSAIMKTVQETYQYVHDNADEQMIAGRVQQRRAIVNLEKLQDGSHAATIESDERIRRALDAARKRTQLLRDWLEAL